MKSNNKFNKGITLIALVITIVVIIILSSVALSFMLTGNGLLTKTQEGRFKIRMQEIAEKLGVYKISTAVEYMKQISNNNIEEANANLYAGEILKDIIAEEELEIEDNQVKDIKKVIESIKPSEEEYLMVYQGELYYVSQNTIHNNKKQEQWCEEIGIKVWDFNPPTGIQMVNGQYECINGLYMCTPQLKKGFDRYKTRYIKSQEDYLIPGTWINKTPEDDWYNYSEHKWANIYTENNGIESYFVWIPRYVYKTNPENQQAGNQRMDVKFVDTSNNYKYLDENGNEQTIPWEGTGTAGEQCLKDQGYKIPDAFYWTNQYENESNSKTALPGYWAAKYQLTNSETKIVNYSVTTSASAILIQNLTKTTDKTVAKYTFAINGKIVQPKEKDGVYTIDNLSKGTYTVNVTALDGNGQIIGSMSQDVEISVPNKPDLRGFNTKEIDETTGNKLPVAYYVLYDETGTNATIGDKITNDGSNAPNDWYDYSMKKWANIVVTDGTIRDGQIQSDATTTSYFVWIPRYQYKTDSTQRTFVRFLEGTSSEIEEGWKIPDAFTWTPQYNNPDNEKVQLPGYWASKYQLSN